MEAAPSHRFPDLDPLSAAGGGAAVASVAALVWPELESAVVSLVAATSFVVWIRALRAWRSRRETGYRPGRLLPLLSVGLAGWLTVLLVEPFSRTLELLFLGGLGGTLWFVAGPRMAGI